VYDTDGLGVWLFVNDPLPELDTVPESV
jgi:hypothetical protein